MNKTRKVMKDIYELRKLNVPPISGLESMYMTCAQFFTDAREFTPVAQKLLEELPNRSRMDRILKFAKDWRAEGAIFIQQKFCDPHETDIPFVRKALEEEGIPMYFLEFDLTTAGGTTGAPQAWLQSHVVRR